MSDLRKLFWAAAVLLCGALGPAASEEIRSSVVVVVRNDQVWDSEGNLDPDEIGRMMEMGLQALAGASSGRAAFERLFKPGERIAVKVNAITKNWMSSSKPALVQQTVDLLQQVGISPDHITIFDRMPRPGRHELGPAGFALNTNAGSVQVVEGGMLGPERQQGSLKTRFYAPVEECDALISIPVLKDHHIMGMTFALKNHFGSIHNPWSCHQNAGVPGIAELNGLEPIQKKQRLIIGDALAGQYNKGPHDAPKYHWKENALIFGFDPVAVDFVAFEILEAKRRQEGLAWPESMRYGGKAGAYILDCSQRGVGRKPDRVIQLRCSSDTGP
ncbi:MAG TPA: DUF362 domain-containing protein [Kiritimatiellia bacterium]|nr:DUF362 domain-containing protein [Kiritimatiellia bacterium]HRZ12467.1 DUF362 domain-containing protein [Kiritimatiellia bacterium]HSA17775.1 DUF362 domain-containing protein [Kiritimatiellia bacterium]